jgi:hypothetical protein
MHAPIKKQVAVLVLLLSIFWGFEVNAAHEITLNATGSNSTNVIENTSSRLRVSNTISSFNTLLLKTEKAEFVELMINSYSKTNTIGSPQLPVLSRLIEIPYGSVPEVKIISYELKEYKLADFGITQKLFPAQAPQSKNNDRNNPVEFNNRVYATNSFYGETIARIEVAGNLRNVLLANLILSPLEYNPVTNTIRVYDNLVVEINFAGANKLKSVENKAKTESPYYENVFSNVLNHQPSDTKSMAIPGIPVKYVIVSDPMFKDALQPFVNWKTKRGFKVIEAYTNDPSVGTSLNSIKAYLSDMYHAATATDPAPTFVLFVGDVTQIPAFDCGDHVSDLYYCEYTGDYLPEVFYGRFSANTVDELLPQINKTLQYEQYLMPDPSFLNEVVMAAGADATHQMRWGNGQVNYGTTHYFNESHKLVSHTYLQPEQAGKNYSKNIQADISRGVSYANYSAHGSAEGWSDPLFTISDVAKLQNEGKYGLIVGNSCQTNAFEKNTFGEALLRAENKGALGYIGASGLTYWDEDYWWSVGNGSIVSNPTYENSGPGAYDRIFHDHGEPRSEWYSTMGQMVFAGNLAVQESNSGMKKQYWEMYCLMGDPSTMVYFGVPAALIVDYTPLIPINSPAFEVRTEPFAYVAVSKNNVLHGVAVADENGLAVVSLKPFTEQGYANIVVTMQNRQPHIDSVKVATPEGPYLVLKSALIKDEEGNKNNLPEYGEPLTVDIELENFGNSGARRSYSRLSTNDSFCTLKDDSHYWTRIAGKASALAENAFKLQVSDNVPDMHNATFTVTTQTDTNTFRSEFNIVVYAPELSTGNIRIDDSASGNGNGQIDPGETILIHVPTTNTGHSISGEVAVQLFLFGGFVNSNSPSFNLGKLAPGETGYSVFTLTFGTDVPIGNHFDLYVISTAGSYNSVSGVMPVVGTQIEDFETYDFLEHNWQFKGVKPWEIDASVKSEGLYGAKSGTVNNGERSEMYLEAKVLFDDSISFYRKVSSESGYDFLKFYMDKIELGNWSGNKDWIKVSYPVKAGSHRFSWVYEKDEATSSGLDAAWIDYIQFPPFSQVPSGPLTINTLAVPDTICEGENSMLYVFASGGSNEYNYLWTASAKLPNAEIFNPSTSPRETTTYDVTVTSGLFSANSNVTVNVEHLPAAPVITALGDHLLSSAKAGNQWYNSQGLIAGATGQNYYPSTTDNYYAIVKNAKGCSSNISNEVAFGFTAAESFVETGFSVYPNPFKRKLIINYSTKSAGEVKIVIYNSLGEEINIFEEGEKANGNYTFVFDGSRLPSGIYTCKVFSVNGVQLAKVIKN